MLTPEQIINFFGFCLAVGVGIGGLYLGLRRSLNGKMNNLDNDRKAEIQELRKDINDRKNENQDLQRDLDATRRDNRELKTRIESVNASLDSANNVVRDVDRHNAKLQGQVEEQRKIYGDQMEEQRKQLVQQAGDIALLQSQVAERDTQIASLKQGVEGKDKTLTDANITIDKLRTELGTEQTAREALTKRVDELEVQVKAMQADKETLIKENSDLKAQNEALTSENAGLKAEILALKLMVTPLPAGVTSADPIIIAPEPQS